MEQEYSLKKEYRGEFLRCVKKILRPELYKSDDYFIYLLEDYANGLFGRPHLDKCDGVKMVFCPEETRAGDSQVIFMVRECFEKEKNGGRRRK